MHSVKIWSLSNNFWFIQCIHGNRESQPRAQPRRNQKHATDFLKDIKKPHMKFHYLVFQKSRTWLGLTIIRYILLSKIIIFGCTALLKECNYKSCFKLACVIRPYCKRNKRRTASSIVVITTGELHLLKLRLFICSSPTLSIYKTNLLSFCFQFPLLQLSRHTFSLSTWLKYGYLLKGQM